MSKVKAELKTGATIEVYEGEKYRLWKKGLVVVDKKQQDKYEDKQANEPVVKMRKALEGTKTDRLNKRIEKLEKRESEDLGNKISKLEDELISVLDRLDKLEKVPNKPAPSQNK